MEKGGSGYTALIEKVGYTALMKGLLYCSEQLCKLFCSGEKNLRYIGLADNGLSILHPSERIECIEYNGLNWHGLNRLYKN